MISMMTELVLMESMTELTKAIMLWKHLTK